MGKNIILNNLNVKKKKNEVCNPLDDFNIHPDIIDLLWMLDGPNKNISVFEPSAISTNCVISKPSNYIESPPYYPSYSTLTPEQRWTYLKMLENPYNPNIHIGYIFLLYYGLERHLAKGSSIKRQYKESSDNKQIDGKHSSDLIKCVNKDIQRPRDENYIFDKVFYVIFKLRDVHKNKSFLQYSYLTLLSNAFNQGKFDIFNNLLPEFSDASDFYQLPFDLFLVHKIQTKKEILPKELMMWSRIFEPVNENNIIRYYHTTFIKKHYDLFLLKLKEIFINSFSEGKFYPHHYLKLSGISKYDGIMFSNPSLSNHKIRRYKYWESSEYKNQFEMICDKLLREARKLVKIENKQSREICQQKKQ